MPKRRHKRRFSGWTTLVWVVGCLVYLFLILPIFVIFLSAFSPNAYPEFPPTGFSVKWFSAIVGDAAWSKALTTSIILLVIVTLVTVVLGTTAAYAIARLEFKGKQALQAFLLSPLMVPQIVLGIALLYLFTDMGIIGSMKGLIIGHVIVAFPYVLRTVGVSVSNLNPKLELASMNLGAGPVRTFFRVTLPLIKPGIVAGGVFSAVTSFGEVSISLFVSSPKTVTVPVRVFNYIEQTFDPAVNAVSVIFIAVAVVALIIIERTIGLTKVM
ncbi:ABC transporter permease [Paenibacillus mendelii]|uniref:ABC transporter permease n=1 Tax=Paenibacillus mendelii TaxID=206163 RepID=A0ABV6J849_9BACL